MLALTIIQPFAELIARGDKRVENRNWPTNHRGRIAIHAGKAKIYAGDSVGEIASWYRIDPQSLAFGAIIATAELIDCVKMEGLVVPAAIRVKHPWLAAHEHAEGPYCFVLANVRRVKPLPMKGALGFWDLDAVARNQGVSAALEHIDLKGTQGSISDRL